MKKNSFKELLIICIDPNMYKIKGCHESEYYMMNRVIVVLNTDEVVDLSTGKNIIKHNGIEKIFCSDIINIIILDNSNKLVWYSKIYNEDFTHYYRKVIICKNVVECKKLKSSSRCDTLIYVVDETGKMIIKMTQTLTLWPIKIFKLGPIEKKCENIEYHVLTMDTEILNMLMNDIIVYFGNFSILTASNGKISQLKIVGDENTLFVKEITTHKNFIKSINSHGVVCINDSIVTSVKNGLIKQYDPCGPSFMQQIKKIKIDENDIEYIDMSTKATIFIKTKTSVIMCTKKLNSEFESKELKLSFDVVDYELEDNNLRLFLYYFENDKLKILQMKNFDKRKDEEIKMIKDCEELVIKREHIKRTRKYVPIRSVKS